MVREEDAVPFGIPGEPAQIRVTLQCLSHSPWGSISCPQPGALLQNHSVSYLDRLGARDDDRGFVEDIDPHDGPILLSPGNQSDAKEAVNYQRCEHQQINSGSAGETGCPIPGVGGTQGSGA